MHVIYECSHNRTLFGTKVTGVSYDAAAAIWRVETSRGDALTADFVVLGLGT